MTMVGDYKCIGHSSTGPNPVAFSFYPPPLSAAGGQNLWHPTTAVEVGNTTDPSSLELYFYHNWVNGVSPAGLRHLYFCFDNSIVTGELYWDPVAGKILGTVRSRLQAVFNVDMDVNLEVGEWYHLVIRLAPASANIGAPYGESGSGVLIQVGKIGTHRDAPSGVPSSGADVFPYNAGGNGGFHQWIPGAVIPGIAPSEAFQFPSIDSEATSFRIFSLGCRPDFTAGANLAEINRWIGGYCEMRFWRSVRTDAQIASNRNSFIGADLETGVADSDLVHYSRLNERLEQDTDFGSNGYGFTGAYLVNGHSAGGQDDFAQDIAEGFTYAGIWRMNRLDPNAYNAFNPTAFNSHPFYPSAMTFLVEIVDSFYRIASPQAPLTRNGSYVVIRQDVEDKIGDYKVRFTPSTLDRGATYAVNATQVETRDGAYAIPNPLLINIIGSYGLRITGAAETRDGSYDLMFVIDEQRSGEYRLTLQPPAQESRAGSYLVSGARVVPKGGSYDIRTVTEIIRNGTYRFIFVEQEDKAGSYKLFFDFTEDRTGEYRIFVDQQIETRSGDYDLAFAANTEFRQGSYLLVETPAAATRDGEYSLIAGTVENKSGDYRVLVPPAEEQKPGDYRLLIGSFVVGGDGFFAALQLVNPEHWWTLGELGGSVASDIGAAGGGDGTNTLATPGAAGIISGAESSYLFDTTGAQVVADDSTTWQTSGGSDSFTIGAWVNINSFSGLDVQNILSKVSFARLVIFNDGTVQFRRTTSAASFVECDSPPGVIVPGNSYFIVATFERAVGEGMKLFVNGVEVAQNTAFNEQNTPLFQFMTAGRSAPTAGENFDGRIQHAFMTLDRFLSPTEIANLYAAAFTGSSPGQGEYKIASPQIETRDGTYDLTFTQLEERSGSYGTRHFETVPGDYRIRDTNFTTRGGSYELVDANSVSVSGSYLLRLFEAASVFRSGSYTLQLTSQVESRSGDYNLTNRFEVARGGQYRIAGQINTLIVARAGRYVVKNDDLIALEALRKLAWLRQRTR